MGGRPTEDEDENEDEELDPLSGRVVVYVAMLGATMAGLFLGIGLDTVAGWRTVLVPLGCSVALEAVAGARVGAVKLGGPLSPRDAGRLGATYSAGLVAVSVPLVGWIEASRTTGGGGSPWTPARFVLALLLVVVGTLARWGLMILLAPRPRP